MFNRKQGFSLTEVLVSVATVMLLIALMVPMLGCKHKESFLSRQCQNRMRKWARAFNSYGSDYDQVYPAAYWTMTEDGSSVPADYRGWWKPGLVGAYIDAVAEYQGETLPDLASIGVGCPSVPGITSAGYPGYGIYQQSFNNEGHGAGISQKYMDLENGCTELAKVTSLSEKALMAETGDAYFLSYWGVYQKGGYRFYQTVDEFLYTMYYTTNFPNMPHKYGANYLFFDGHVKWYQGFPSHEPYPAEMFKMCDAYEECAAWGYY